MKTVLLIVMMAVWLMLAVHVLVDKPNEPVVTYLHSPLTSPNGAEYVCTYAVAGGEVVALIGCMPDLDGRAE